MVVWRTELTAWGKKLSYPQQEAGFSTTNHTHTYKTTEPQKPSEKRAEGKLFAIKKKQIKD